ncbi:receptor-like protein [Vigna angularis]|uniref:Receptor-like protein n=1 Tax=Phaseolus angularis TaxID=3914 RepID=A0A8T0JYL2_PHAAN|nr:receptor-like protein [Vigna angularis]
MILTFMLLFTILIAAAAASSSCPMDLTYVQTIPWNTSICKDPVNKNLCCKALSSIFGIGLAEHLKETSMFYLPDVNTSSACLSDFKHHLAAISVKPNIVSFCFPHPTQFVTNSSACAGITTLQDWNQKVTMDSPVKTSCKGDLKDQTLCSNCIQVATELVSNLTRIDPNANAKCFYYTVLYVAAVANPFGTTDLSTTGCILGLTQPSNAVTRGLANKRRKKIKLVIMLLGGVGVVFALALALMVVYRKWDKRRKKNVQCREVENEMELWLPLRKFLVGDEEFFYEVEIISKIKHRNLLPLRGCCVTSDNLKDWVWALAETGKMEEIFEESIREGSVKTMERFVYVGMLCSHLVVAFRPTIVEALKMLEEPPTNHNGYQISDYGIDGEGAFEHERNLKSIAPNQCIHYNPFTRTQHKGYVRWT